MQKIFVNNPRFQRRRARNIHGSNNLGIIEYVDPYLHYKLDRNLRKEENHSKNAWTSKAKVFRDSRYYDNTTTNRYELPKDGIFNANRRKFERLSNRTCVHLEFKCKDDIIWNISRKHM